MKAAHTEVAAAPQQNPGEILRQARERRDWSQADVARKLNLTVTSLNNLEAGAFDKLPGHTFARGYIRAYAKLMDLDQAPLVAAFDQCTGSHAKGSDVHSLGRIEEPVRLSHNILRGVSLLLLLVVIGGGFVWWQDQGSQRNKDLGKMAMEHVEVESADGTTQIHPLDEPEDQAVAAGQQQAQSAPLPLNVEGAAGSSGVEGQAAETPAATAEQGTAATPAQTVTAPVGAPSVAAAPASTAAATPSADAVPAGAASLAIQFSGDCWTQVRDGDGKQLYMGIKHKGESLALNGKPPFAVRLGFARVAQVSFNGQPVDVAKFTSGETARLKLGQ